MLTNGTWQVALCMLGPLSRHRWDFPSRNSSFMATDTSSALWVNHQKAASTSAWDVYLSRVQFGFQFQKLLHPCQNHWSTSMVKGSSSDITVAQGTPIGSSLCVPLKLPTEEVPIYLLTLGCFQTAGVSDRNSACHMTATRSQTQACRSSNQHPNHVNHALQIPNYIY